MKILEASCQVKQPALMTTVNNPRVKMTSGNERKRRTGFRNEFKSQDKGAGQQSFQLS